MSREHIRQVIEHFIDNKNPEVLAVSGPWGVGKTFALQEIIAAYRGYYSLKRYAYVSLFGVRSLAELRTSMLTRRRPFPYADRPITEERPSLADELGLSRLTKYISKIPMRDATNQAREALPWGGKHVIGALETVAGAYVAETLIVLDDLERISDALSMRDVLGLVSSLKEEAASKIIIVYNEGELGANAETFNLYSEKVIDQKLTFSLSPSEAADLGFSQDTPLRTEAIKYVEQLEISNIRVIKKIEKAIKLIFPLVRESAAQLQTQLACGVCVFAAALYERGRGFGTPEEIKQFNVFSRTVRSVRGERETQPDPFWIALLERCQYRATDEFDAAVLTVMERGYIAGAGIEEIIAAKNAIARRVELDAKFSDAWNRFHNRLDTDAASLVRGFAEAVDEAAVTISPVNMNSTVKLMRDLGFDNEANQAIESYINQRRNTPAVFDIDGEPQMGEVDDPTFRARCLQIFEETHKLLSLQQVAAIIIPNETWDDEIPATLAAAEPAELVALVKEHQGPQLNRLVTGILQAHGTDEQRQRIRINMTAALTIIANESSVNKLRVKRWGITVDAAPQGHMEG